MSISMMKKQLCALAVMSAVSAPALAESVDVRVTGTITPAACTPTVTGGGVIDYGNISASSLSATDYTVLPEKSAEFTIQCDAPTKVAVNAVNMRQGTLAGPTEQGPDGAGQSSSVGIPLTMGGSSGWAVVGLGLTPGNAPVGGYAIGLLSGTATADGVTVDNLGSADSGVTWAAGSSQGLYSGTASNRLVTWAASGTTTPVAFKTLNATLGVQAYINKASELDLSQPVNLDGLTTIEMVYL